MVLRRLIQSTEGHSHEGVPFSNSVGIFSGFMQRAVLKLLTKLTLRICNDSRNLNELL